MVVMCDRVRGPINTPLRLLILEPRLARVMTGPRRGFHPKIAQERLGHSNVSITLNTYSVAMAEIVEAEG